MKETDEGIFLQRIPYSDSSLIVTFYTRKRGLQKFLFKGGKKKSHSVFPLSVAELTFYGRQDSDLLNLTKVEGKKAYHFPFDPIKGTVAFFMAETLLKCVHQGDADEFFYAFASNAVDQLEDAEQLSYFPLSFLIQCCDVLGFEPLCENDESKFFNLDAGQFQISNSPQQRTYSGEAVDLIRSMISSNEPAISPTKKVREQALEIMIEYMKIHVPQFKKLDSYEIVKEVLSL